MGTIIPLTSHALRKKQAGRAIEPISDTQPTRVINLMSALRATIEDLPLRTTKAQTQE